MKIGKRLSHSTLSRIDGLVVETKCTVAVEQSKLSISEIAQKKKQNTKMSQFNCNSIHK